MMAYLRQWLLGVVSCAFLVSIFLHLMPEGAVREIGRLCGGLVLILSLLRPLGSVEVEELALSLTVPTIDRAALETEYEEENDARLAAVIAERAGAYIEDKARAMDLRVTARVEVREKDGLLVPERIVLYGEENGELAALIERELDVPREKQEWRAAE